MKSIFKFYIFKLVILSITMIFISFGASASTIKTIYSLCKPYQISGFNMSDNPTVDAVICQTYLRALMDSGLWNCRLLEKAKENGADTESGEFKMTKILMANDIASIEALITSFIKYAENNPNEWDNPVASRSSEFLAKDFPCKLDK